MPHIPWAEWLPDQPAIATPALATAKNVYPRTAASYGALSGLATYSANALDARAQGAFAARDTAGTVANFAGDAARLYKLANAAWSDVSRPGGYTTAPEECWQFVQFGTRALATNFSNPIQTWTLGSSSTFADLAAAAPQARHIAQWRDFIAVGNTYDAVDGNRPNRVWWAAIDDPTDWPTPGSAAAQAVQSDRQDLPDGGYIRGITGAIAGTDGAVFGEQGIYRVTYEGPPTIFRFDMVDRARGCVAAGSIVNNGTFAAYLANDGWYVFDGFRSLPIGGQKIDKWFYADLDQNYLHRITGVVDPINKLFFWSYPGAGNSGGTPNRLLIYNWALQRWSQAEVACELVFRSLSEGYTLEGLDATGYTLDQLPYSLDSRAWTGGSPFLSAIDPAHRLALFNGATLAAELETTNVALDGGMRIFVTGVRPLIDGAAPTVEIGAADTPQASPAFTAAAGVGADGRVPARLAARYVRIRMKVAAAATWTHTQGFEPGFQPEGRR